MKAPCHDCLILPICRYKSYHLLIEECELVFEYLKLSEEELLKRPLLANPQSIRIVIIEEILKPTRWQWETRRDYK